MKGCIANTHDPLHQALYRRNLGIVYSELLLFDLAEEQMIQALTTFKAFVLDDNNYFLTTAALLRQINPKQTIIDLPDLQRIS